MRINLGRIVGGVKVALDLNHPGPDLEVFSDDTFIVSYPKSGNTWTRFLIANLVYPDTPASFANINDLIPDPEALSRKRLARLPRPRILKSHQYFDPRYREVINIVRDPRDVALSEFHFQRKGKVIEDNFPIDEWVKRFIKGETTPYGSWGENVGSWLAARYGRPGFLLVRYEDMLSRADLELTRIASFLRIDRTSAHVSQAVKLSSADRMRELEKTQALLWSSTKRTRQDIPFVRSATSGGWRSDLPMGSVALIETAWGSLMHWLGYELASDTKVVSGFKYDSILGVSAT